MIEDIFETRKGIYRLDTASGLFTVKDRRSTPKIFIGSVDPNWMVEVSGKKMVLEEIVPAYRGVEALLNLVSGNTAGFTPEFRVGYRPFGIVCEASDILFVAEQKMAFSEEMRKRIDQDSFLQIELGSKIEKVYRQLRDEERRYGVQK